jgi:FMN-dependent NADH-azoreductase
MQQTDREIETGEKGREGGREKKKIYITISKGPEYNKRPRDKSQHCQHYLVMTLPSPLSLQAKSHASSRR